MGGLLSLLELHRCPHLSDFQQKMSRVLSYSEKLLKEKEALSEALSSSVDEAGRRGQFLHHCTVCTTMSMSPHSGTQASRVDLIVPNSSWKAFQLPLCHLRAPESMILTRVWISCLIIILLKTVI